MTQIESSSRTNQTWPRLVSAVVVALGLAVVAMVVTAAATPCESDDAASNFACHWDASARGNGLGHDFTAFGHGRWVINL